MPTIIDENKNISHTRGDYLPLRIPLKNKDGSDYIVQENDKVRFKIYANKDVTNVIIQKDFIPEVGTSYVDIDILSDEMKIGDYIDKTVTYCYEVSLNPDTDHTVTILGVERKNSKDVPKYFYLTPEAGENNNGN